MSPGSLVMIECQVLLAEAAAIHELGDTVVPNTPCGELLLEELLSRWATWITGGTR